jgi:hypothetical protein
MLSPAARYQWVGGSTLRPQIPYRRESGVHECERVCLPWKRDHLFETMFRTQTWLTSHFAVGAGGVIVEGASQRVAVFQKENGHMSEYPSPCMSEDAAIALGLPSYLLRVFSVGTECILGRSKMAASF